MIGKQRPKNKLFVNFNINNFVEADHFLRLVDENIDFSFIYKKTEHLFSSIGRPSIDPEMLIRMLLIGYLYGITSERQLCKRIKYNIAFRWFIKLDIDEKVPDHSIFSKYRHGRFKDEKIFEEIFHEVVQQCINKGFIKGENLYIDGSYVKANASVNKNLEPKIKEYNSKEYLEQMEKNRENKNDNDDNNDNNDNNDSDNKKKEKEVTRVKKTDNKKVDKIESKNNIENKNPKIEINKMVKSKTDPDAKLGKKGKLPKNFYHEINIMMDEKNNMILGVAGSDPSPKAEKEAAEKMLNNILYRFEMIPKNLTADGLYGTRDFVHKMLKRNITPIVPMQENNKKGKFTLKDFKYNKETNKMICPNNKEMNYLGIKVNEGEIKRKEWRGRSNNCRNCKIKNKCTEAKVRKITMHIYEEAAERIRKLKKTKLYKEKMRKRKQIEAIFGHCKDYMGMNKCKYRGSEFVKEQWFLTATAFNIKKMIKSIGKKIGNVGKKVQNSTILEKVYKYLLRTVKSVYFLNLRIKYIKI
jgi:transposase